MSCNAVSQPGFYLMVFVLNSPEDPVGATSTFTHFIIFGERLWHFLFGGVANGSGRQVPKQQQQLPAYRAPWESSSAQLAHSWAVPKEPSPITAVLLQNNNYSGWLQDLVSHNAFLTALVGLSSVASFHLQLCSLINFPPHTHTYSSVKFHLTSQ